MSTPLIIPILAASTGKNLELALTLEQIATELGTSPMLVNLDSLKLPLYTPNEEKKGIPEAALKLSEIMKGASCYILCAPEYNGNLPPLLNNSIAWVSRSGDKNWRAAFNHKLCLLTSHSGGGGIKVLESMRMQMSHLGCVVMGRALHVTPDKPLKRESAVDTLTKFIKIVKSGSLE